MNMHCNLTFFTTELQKFSEQCHENLAMWKERLERYSSQQLPGSSIAKNNGHSDRDAWNVDKKLIFSSRIASPEDFLSAFPPTLPKSFVSPCSTSSNSEADEESSQHGSAMDLQTGSVFERNDHDAAAPSDEGDNLAAQMLDDDGVSLSGSSEYATCESSPPGSPAFSPDRAYPPKLEISTNSTKRSHHRSNSRAHQRRESSVASSSNHLTSPTDPHHHRTPSVISNQSNITNTTTASVTADATAIRNVLGLGPRKKVSSRFNRSSWNPPPTEYKTFVATPTSPQVPSIASPSLPPVVFTAPGFTVTSEEAADSLSSTLNAARHPSADNLLSPLTPESSTASSNVSPLTPDSASSTVPPTSGNAHAFGMAPVYQRLL